MPHAFVTVVVPFPAAQADAVDEHLDRLGNLERSSLAEKLDGSAFVHFMSLAVVRGPAGQPAHLVLEASADGHPDGVLRRLARELDPELRAVLAVAGVDVPPAALDALLVRHDCQVGQGWFAVPGVVFTGTPGMTVGRIRDEAQLAARIQQVLDERPAPGAALATLQAVRTTLFEEGVYKWAFVAEPVSLLADAPPGRGSLRRWASSAWSAVRTFLWPLALPPAVVLPWQGLGAAGLVFGAELVLALGAGGLAYRRLRRREEADVPDDSDPDPQVLGEIMAREDRGRQNHLAAVSRLKAGWPRRLALRLVLWWIGVSSAHHSRPGRLSDIGTIHFARWIVLPGTDTLLFCSNYTGSWESYLDDFILRAHRGLTGVWSNTEGFPRTRNLVQGGAQDGDRFKRWARRQQQPTRFWYAAYPGLTTARIRTNAAIRAGFATAATEAAAARWLQEFRFPAPQVPTIESSEVPTLVFGGLAGLRWASSLLLRLSDAPGAARAWLAAIEPDLGYGERKPDRSTLVLGLSAGGLRKLGLDRQALSTFSVAFQHGMAAPWRARALGDVGDNAPAGWWWGGPGREADAILNIYAESEALLGEETARRAAEVGRFEGDVVHAVRLDEVPPKNAPIREPFGFTDGISQPIVRGTRRWMAARSPLHVVEPGEMILGYPDNLGYRPPSPSAGGCPDLGRNGSYLVVRQLEQDRAGFQAFLDETATRLVGDPRVPAGDARRLADWIAAKMVGRWPDGTSLVRYPDRPGSLGGQAAPDNDFLFGAEDPDGLRCPFGAHIRRANPRESFEPGSPTQLAIANRHRIFRVGRAYGPQNGSRNPGLLFMCVNANLERQFEFVQQTYLLGASFHGLENEIDAFARRPGASGVLTIPTERGPLRLRRMTSFVTVRGGGYFFMPGRAAVRFLAGRDVSGSPPAGTRSATRPA